VRLKLLSWGASKEVISSILSYLIEERYVDESRYANAFVKDKYRFNRWGVVKIKMALRQKKLPNEIIEQALELIDKETNIENLLEIIKTKRRTIHDIDYQKIKGKLFRFGISRGFESQSVLQTISKILKNEDIEDLE
jgi:regulatory protein